MEAQDVVVFCALVNKYIKKKKNNRRYWIHPINTARYLHGAYFTLYHQLRQDEEKFFNYFRMSITSFDELLLNISDSIKCADTKFRKAISPEEKLAITLRYV